MGVILASVWQSGRGAMQSYAASLEASFDPVADALLRPRPACGYTGPLVGEWPGFAGLLSRVCSLVTVLVVGYLHPLAIIVLAQAIRRKQPLPGQRQTGIGILSG